MRDWPGWVKAVIEAMPTDRETDAPASTIPPRLFLLWLVLARYADNTTGEAWPSLTTLARRVGCDRSHLTRALAEGERRGLWTRNRAGGGSRDTTRYRVHRIPTSGQSATSGGYATSGQSAPRLVAKAQHRTKPVNKAITSVKKPRAKRPESDKPKARKPDPVWDAVADLFFNGCVAKPHQARAGKIVRDLKILDATPDDIRRRLDRYRATWPKAAATGEALVKHWQTFADPIGPLDAEPVTPPDEVFHE